MAEEMPRSGRGRGSTAKRSSPRRPSARGGATASYAASKAGGGLLYAGIKLMNKKKAGGLPDKVMIAVTPEKVYAFKLKVGRDYKLGDEVAVWDRGGLKIDTTASRG